MTSRLPRLGKGKLESCSMSDFSLEALLDSRRGEDLDLWARTINPQFVRVLRTIGFDRTWARSEGAYLYDTDGARYLDLLGGFGMYGVGRNNPRVRAALAEALELETPGMLAMGTTLLPGLLAEALIGLAGGRIERCLFTSSGSEAVESAIKLGRTATGRTRVLSADHAFHGLTLGALSANGGREFTDRFRPLLPGFEQVPFGDLEALEEQLQREDVALLLVEPVQGKGINIAPDELAMAAGLATLHELREQRLVEQSARLGERLLELTRPLVDEFEVVRDVRGLGLAWAIEFGEPQGGGRMTYRMIERTQRGLFAQLVIVPLFTEHHILTQVAGHEMAVIRILPPLVVTEPDLEEFADALRTTIKHAQGPKSLTKLALTAAGAAVSRR